MNTKTQTVEQTGVNTVRILAAGAVQKANSGHPGKPMGLASMRHVLSDERVWFSVENIIKELKHCFHKV